MMLACALTACSGLASGDREYSLTIARSADKVYAPFSSLTNYDSPLIDLGVPFKRVVVTHPEKHALLFHIPSTEDAVGSNILMRFKQDGEGKTQLDVSVHVPELLVPDLGPNLQIDEKKVASELERAIRNLGRNLERGDDTTLASDEISRLFDVITVLTNREVLKRVTGLDRKGIDLGDLFESQLGGSDADFENPQAAQPMSDPDQG
ncbi:MAG: hypothetical protein ABW039_02210, partial [Sphingobium sp.]